MDDIAASPVLVLGGTGHYGRRIVEALTKVHARVRVLSRKASPARDLLGPQVEIVEGDVLTPGVTRRAMEGARSIVIALAAMTRTTARQLWAVERDAVLRALEEAQASGVRRVVYLSGYEIRTELLNRLGIWGSFGMKAEVESALQRSDLNWTILGEAISMEMYFAMLRGDTLYVPGGGPPRLPTVSPLDVGLIAAQAALRNDLGKQRFHVTGPEALSFSEAARRMGQVMGRLLRMRAIPLTPMRAVLRVAGLFNPYFEYLRASILLLNHFPQDLAAGVPEAHRRLVATFQYEPTALETETRRRMSSSKPSIVLSGN